MARKEAKEKPTRKPEPTTGIARCESCGKNHNVAYPHVCK